MRYVALLTPGPAWVAGRTVYDQGPVIQRHLEAMRARYDAGELLLGGPFTSGEQGIAVLDVVDESSAAALLDADPAVEAGVLVYDLTAVRAYFDAYDGTRTDARVDQLDPAGAAPSGGRRAS